jgi:cyclic pyranopterin phosphate synthase
MSVHSVDNHVFDQMNRSLRDLRISVTDRCNFRCTYCMPEEKYHRHFKFMKTEERLDFGEIVRLARLFAGAGVRKLRITGGEPLLRPADRVTVSLDALDAKIFREMSGGRGGLARVLDGVEAALEANLAPVKINAVVQRGVNDEVVPELLDYFRHTGVIVRLIEYMDVGNINHWRESDTVPSAELRARIGERWPLRAERRNYDGEVATRHLYEDGAGEIGFISSVTEPFCGSCHRARLSSDGQLFTCLFATAGTDLRQPLRDGASDEELASLISRVWSRRSDRYSEKRALLHRHGREIQKMEMYYIGG